MPAYQGEHNEEILKELQISDEQFIMQEKNVILSSR